MRFVSHQTTLHLSFEIKCCVDRLRPRGKGGPIHSRSAFDPLMRLIDSFLSEPSQVSDNLELRPNAPVSRSPLRAVTCNWKPIASSTLKTVLPWAACKSSIKARSFNSGFFRDVRDVVSLGDDANGFTYFVDVSTLKCMIEVICRLAG